MEHELGHNIVPQLSQYTSGSFEQLRSNCGIHARTRTGVSVNADTVH